MYHTDQTIYRIYGKLRTAKKFKPFDSNTGTLVTNLIYATFFRSDMKSLLEDEIKYLNDNNPEYIFELRKF